MSSSKKKAASSPIEEKAASTEENIVVSEGNDAGVSAPPSRSTPASSSTASNPSGSSQDVPDDYNENVKMPQMQQQPIPPPSEAQQFRAIGILQGLYVPSEEQFNRGELVTREGLRLDAVLLGQVMSLVKKYIDLALPHLWVVYPRTRDEEPMHVQLVGVWSPEGFESLDESQETDEDTAETSVIQASLSPLESLKPPLKDGFFSIRGQVIQQDPERHSLFVKIQQTSRKKNKTAKAFKLKLIGDIPQKPMGYFWDFEVVRDGDTLKIEKATPISFMPMKKKKRVGGERRPSSEDGAPVRKPIKKSVPLGQEHGRPETRFSPPPTAAPKKTPAPARPLPKKIIRQQDSD